MAGYLRHCQSTPSGWALFLLRSMSSQSKVRNMSMPCGGYFSTKSGIFGGCLIHWHHALEMHKQASGSPPLQHWSDEPLLRYGVSGTSPETATLLAKEILLESTAVSPTLATALQGLVRADYRSANDAVQSPPRSVWDDHLAED
ncbi:hypothetical protein BDV39DRAFT_104247 [Aspergillus sergii]|uniref:Uncharacterized protein n=1 Tax=Aspergillus sergii TaxID=1034303 RepID=A0A5N6WWU7_9EURO|nr:hypothetical protein BDV39DRAFT_104247 [Aspergillus sergii]